MTATFRFGRFEVSPATRQLLLDRQPVPLGARAFDVLLALIKRRDRVVTKNEMLDVVWSGVVVEENNLQVQVSALQKVLGPDAVATVPGRGYRFTLQVETVPSSESHAASIPSIAVLPFANVSDDSTNEYFADGLSEELLNVLAKIRGLRVASRTSTFYFKGKAVDLATMRRSSMWQRCSRVAYANRAAECA